MFAATEDFPFRRIKVYFSFCLNINFRIGNIWNIKYLFISLCKETDTVKFLFKKRVLC